MRKPAASPCPSKADLFAQMTEAGRKRYSGLLEPADEKKVAESLPDFEKVQRGLELAGKVDAELLSLQFSV